MLSLMKGRLVPARSRRSIGRVLSALLFAGLFTVACKDATGPEPLTTLTLTPATSTTTPTGTVQLAAAGTRTGIDVTNIVGETYAVTSGGGTVSSTGLFTAPTTPGTSTVTVTCAGLTATATITTTVGPLATLVVTPETTTRAPGGTQTFTAVGRDAFNNIVEINPTWSVVNGGGTVPAGATGTTVVFTAGNIAGTYTNTVRAVQGTLADSSTVIVTPAPVAPAPAPTIPAPPPPVAPLPPPVPAAGYRMIARVAWTCTNGSITGSVATNQTTTEVPPGAVTQTLCPVTGSIDIGSAAAKQAYQDFLVAYAARAATACGTTLTGTLAGQILAPGVYCFDNAATLTGTLTLAGSSTGVWLFKVGHAGIPGALTGTNFNVVMAGGASACNVTWWVRQASTMNTSNFQGHILAGAGVSFTGGTYKGNAWSQEDVTVTGTTVTACDAP